jgi:tRNA A-37 threonylcarbamoyl transferase component Bud32
MKDIEELIKNVEKYKKAIIQRKFKSKKNTVAYVTINNRPRVLKWFAPGFKRQMTIEHEILQKGSSKLKIPSIFEMDEENNVLTMSYITGENLCEIINDEQTIKSRKEKLMILIAKWFAYFHTHFKEDNEFLIRGDATLRNFLLSDQIWGIDFEEARLGEPTEDIATLCASILSTDPLFTPEKFQLCQKFIYSYTRSVTWTIKNINQEIAYALLQRIQYRPEYEEILRNYAQRIRDHGLTTCKKSPIK